MTTGICAPTLLDFGSEDQKRGHVARMIRGEEVWTQLLSEPGAGSDLAGLQTRAVRDGDEYVINGQKVWTSGARDSDYALCVARTNPDVPKHQGLSMFVVDLRAPGVTIRPLRQMTGDSHFNEVFLDDVKVAVDDLVGRQDDGWRALTAMLTHERLALGAGTGAGGSGQGWTRPASARFIELARQSGLNDDPTLRQELVKLYIAERVLAYMGQKMRDEIAAGIPVGSKGSVAKLATALISRQSASLGMMIAGARSQAWDPSDPNGPVLRRRPLFFTDDGDCRRDQRDPAKHHRRAGPRTAEGAPGRPRHRLPRHPPEPGPARRPDQLAKAAAAPAPAPPGPGLVAAGRL